MLSRSSHSRRRCRRSRRDAGAARSLRAELLAWRSGPPDPAETGNHDWFVCWRSKHRAGLASEKRAVAASKTDCEPSTTPKPRQNVPKPTLAALRRPSTSGPFSSLGLAFDAVRLACVWALSFSAQFPLAQSSQRVQATRRRKRSSNDPCYRCYGTERIGGDPGV